MADEMSGRVCVVTGANSGVGRAVAQALAERGARVILICRRRERGEQAIREIAAAVPSASLELVVADLSSQAEVRRAAAEILARCGELHVLINNAAVLLPAREQSEDGLEKMFATNYLSHFLLTHLLLPRLAASAPARVINVATLTRGRGLKINFDDLMLEKRYSLVAAFGQTKLALILFTKQLAAHLAGSGVTVNAVHPGFVKTALLDDLPCAMRALVHLFSGTAERGARTPVYLAASDEVAQMSGRLFANCKPAAITGQANDAEAARQLWDVSLALTNTIPSLEGRIGPAVKTAP